MVKVRKEERLGEWMACVKEHTKLIEIDPVAPSVGQGKGLGV